MSQFRSILRSLVTEHLLAKFFAVSFAVVTVYLIEREVADNIEWLDRRVPVHIGQGADERFEDVTLVIEKDPRVWIQAVPEDIELRVVGPKNKREAFFENPVIRVQIRQRQVPDDDGRLRPFELVIDDSSLTSDILTVRCQLLEVFKIQVDEIVTREDVPLAIQPPAGLPGNRIIDEERSLFEPRQVKVSGPRHLLNPLGPNKPLLTMINAEVPKKTNTRYDVAVVPASARAGLFFPNAEDRPRFLMVLKEPEPATINLGRLPILWGMNDGVRQAISSGQVTLNMTLSFAREAEVILAGPPSVVAKYPQGPLRQALLKQIRLLADPNKYVESVIGGSQEFHVKLQALGVPPGLSARLDPSRLPVTITRKDTENK